MVQAWGGRRSVMGRVFVALGLALGVLLGLALPSVGRVALDVAGRAPAGDPGAAPAPERLAAAGARTLVTQPLAAPTPTPTARLSGTVTATDGTAVPGATVLVCDAAGAWACDESLTSASGAYTSGTLTDGTYLLQVVPLEPNPVDALPGWYRNAPPANYATSAATATSIAIAGSSQTISLQLPRGSRFRGRVSASDGVAVPGARITPCLAATPTTCYAEVLAGAAGDYTTGVLANGSYKLRIDPPAANLRDLLGGWYRSAAPTNYAATADLATALAAPRSGGALDVRLPFGTRFRGRITASDGTGVAGAGVYLCPVPANLYCSLLYSIGIPASTSAAGDFTTGLFAPGTYAIQVTAPAQNPRGLVGGWYAGAAPGGYAAWPSSASILAVAGGTVPVSVRLSAPNRIRIRLAAADASALTGARVRTCDPVATGVCGQWLSATSGDATAGTPIVVGDGRTLLQVSPPPVRTDLLGGWYRAAPPASFALAATDASPIELTGGASRAVEVRIPAASELRARILGPSGAAVAGATVTFRYCPAPTDCLVVASGRSSSSGDVASGTIPAGAYLVRVDPPSPNPLGLVGGFWADLPPANYAASDGTAGRYPLGATTGSLSVTLPGPTLPTSVRLSILRAGSGASGGSVTSGDGRIACPAICAADYTSGNTVVLTATAAAGTRFEGWSGGGCAAAGTGPCLVRLDATTAVTASFARLVALTVSLAGSGGGRVLADIGGLDCPGSCLAELTAGSTITLAASPEAPGAGIRNVFDGWTGACASAGTGPCTLVLADATTVSAVFTRWLTLTVVRTGDGSGRVVSTEGPTTLPIDCGTTCAAEASAGSWIGLAATAGPGATFAGWAGAGCSDIGPCRLELTAATTVEARFVLPPPPFSVLVTSDPSTGVVEATGGSAFGGARVSFLGSPGAGYRVFFTVVPNPTPGAVPFVADASLVYVAISATAGDGGPGPAGPFHVCLDGASPARLWPFDGGSWGAPGGPTDAAGACRTVDRLSIVVAARPFDLSVARTGSGSGRVVGSAGSGIDCGLLCSAAVPAATLTATPDAGSYFAGWSGGGCDATAATCTLEVTAATTLLARFEPKLAQAIAFTLASNLKAGVSVTLAGTATSGLAVAYVSSAPTVCALSGRTLKILKGGTCTITASQAGSARYLAAAPVARVLLAGTIVSLAQRFGVGTAAPTVTSATLRKGTYLTDQLTTTKALAGKAAALWVRPLGSSTWKRLAVVTVDPYGRARYRFRPSVTMDYQWRFGPVGSWAPSKSAIGRVTVR